MTPATRLTVSLLFALGACAAPAAHAPGKAPPREQSVVARDVTSARTEEQKVPPGEDTPAPPRRNRVADLPRQFDVKLSGNDAVTIEPWFGAPLPAPKK